MRPLSFIFVFFLAQVACGKNDAGQFAQPFTREALQKWCSVARSQADVKQLFGSNPMITASFEETDDPELFTADSIRFSYPVEIGDDARMSIGGSFAPGRTALLFRFRGESLIEVFLFHSLSDKPNEMIWKKEEKEKPPNQALQTTSVTRSGFGKVSVSDRQRRGV
jgi:hypothetical protein